MRYFIAYRFTGEDPKKLEKVMRVVCSSIEGRGDECYCTLWDREKVEKMKSKDVMKHAFEEIDNSDALFVFVNSENKSEGMLMEVGYCLAKNKKIVLAIKESVKKSYLRDIADDVIEFGDLEDLKIKLEDKK